MFHANGWTFVWTVTAVGGTHVCLRKVDPSAIFEPIARERDHDAVRRADRADRHRQRARRRCAQGAARACASSPPARRPPPPPSQRIEGELGWDDHPRLRADRDRAVHHRLRAAARARAALARRERAAIKARQGVELITSGELRSSTTTACEVPHDGSTLGEIIVRGNVVMAGYYNDPEATAAAMRDGWFHSGDAAVVHPDGYVEIRDRLKDVIISGGENISSVEVEGVLLRHPAVQEVGVVGLPHEQWGEAPHAFVVLKPGAAATEDELREFARDQLAHFKAPHGVHVRGGAAEDGDRQDSEVRAARRPCEHRPAMSDARATRSRHCVTDRPRHSTMMTS